MKTKSRAQSRRSNSRAQQARSSLAGGSLSVLSALHKWLRRRAKLAEKCSIKAGLRGDYDSAMRMEYHRDALLPVIFHVRSEMEAAIKRQPKENAAHQPHRGEPL